MKERDQVGEKCGLKGDIKIDYKDRGFNCVE